MEQTTFNWEAIATAASGAITTFLAWWLTRRKHAAEAKGLEAAADSAGAIASSSELQNVEKAIAIWRGTAEEWKREADDLHKELRQVRKDFTALRGEFEDLKRENTALKDEIAALRSAA
jgi:uncharacterized coiled-coil DUF342 family protein